MTQSHRYALGAGFRAPAAQGVAVQGERVQQHFGMIAIGLGALPVLCGVTDQSSVAVRATCQALTAAVSHEPLLASQPGGIPLPRREPDPSEVCNRS